MKRTILFYFNQKKTESLQKQNNDSTTIKQSLSDLKSKRTRRHEVIEISSDEDNEASNDNMQQHNRWRMSRYRDHTSNVNVDSPKVKKNRENISDLLLNDKTTMKIKPLMSNSTSCTTSNLCGIPAQKESLSLSKELGSSLSNSIRDVTSADTNSNYQQFTENEKFKEPDKTTAGQKEEDYEPYYLRNFKLVIETVMNNPADAKLFKDGDDQWMNKFDNLDSSAQKLYVRLFHRKLAWLPQNKISYKEIAENILTKLDILVKENFLQCSLSEEENYLSLHEVLKLLQVASVKTIAKSLHLTPSGHKDMLCCSIEKLCKQQKSVVASSNSSLEHVILKRALNLLGPCYRLSLPPKQAFNRLLLVFDVTKGTEDDSEYSLAATNQPPYYGRNQQLSTVLMAGMGKVVYPTYTISRPTPIFESRQELTEYETAYHLMSDVLAATETSEWKVALEICKNAESVSKTLSEATMQRAAQLPKFLSSYTASAIYTRIKSLQVEILQRMKDYASAAKLLQDLLHQDNFCLSRRGYWAERLALNFDQHLKNAQNALEVIEISINDRYVRVGHVVALVERAKKIKLSKKVKNYNFDNILQDHTICKAKEISIVGRILPKRMQTGKARFMRNIDCDEVLLCSVEELALAHYKNEGFDDGLHGEGGTFTSLFCLLMWDIIFMTGIDDVFRTSYQTHPLDYNSDEFYINRKSKIDYRKEQISMWKSEDFSVEKIITQHWNSYQNVVCTGMNWNLFSSAQHALSLAKCIGGKVMSGIMTILAKDPRHTRSGLPDLVVWNSASDCYKFVEVKGPGDRLSNNQKVWMHQLVRLGADVEICHVTATASRKLH